MQTYRKPYAIERIISSTSYLTAGFTGFIWLIIAAVFRKTVTPFIMYHAMQAIFLSIAFFLLSVIGKMLYVVLYRIPLLNVIPYIINMPIVFDFSILQLFTTVIILYLSITSFMGYFSYLPWVSNIIKANLRLH